MAKAKNQADSGNANDQLDAGQQIADPGAQSAADTAGDSSGGNDDQRPDEKVKARVLARCSLGEPNDVIDVDAELAETMADVIDTGQTAVAYALSIAQE